MLIDHLYVFLSKISDNLPIRLFSHYWVVTYSYVPDTCTRWDLFEIIFFLICGLLFHFLMVFSIAKVLILKSPIYDLSLLFLIRKFSYFKIIKTFSSIIFIILYLHLCIWKILSYFEPISVEVIIFHLTFKFNSTIKKDYFPHWIILVTLEKISWLYKGESLSKCFIVLLIQMFYINTMLYCLIQIYSLKSRMWSPPTWFLF